jgi:nitrogenase-associated protein
VDSRNLLEENWSREKLLDYFDHMSVSMWFNQSAPDITSGKIEPSELSEEEALTMMIENPILIRRPLMRVDRRWRRNAH